MAQKPTLVYYTLPCLDPMHCIQVLGCKQQELTLVNVNHKGVLWQIWN